MQLAELHFHNFNIKMLFVQHFSIWVKKCFTAINVTQRQVKKNLSHTVVYNEEGINIKQINLQLLEK